MSTTALMIVVVVAAVVVAVVFAVVVVSPYSFFIFRNFHAWGKLCELTLMR